MQMYMDGSGFTTKASELLIVSLPAMPHTRIDIRTLSPEALESWFTEQGQQRFRAKQVYEWLWKKSAHAFA